MSGYIEALEAHNAMHSGDGGKRGGDDPAKDARLRRLMAKVAEETSCHG